MSRSRRRPRLGANRDRGGAVRLPQHFLRVGQSFRVIGVEQGCRRSSSDTRELPSQVRSVLHASRNALPSRRAVNVRGVAGEKHAAGVHAIHHPAVDPEVRQPQRFADNPCIDAWSSIRDELLNLLDADALPEAIDLRRDLDEQSPRVPCWQRERGQTAVGMQPDMVVRMGERAFHANVGHEERERIRLPAKRDVRLLADDAVRALTAHEPTGLDRLDSVAASNLGEDVGGILTVAFELCLPLHSAAELAVVVDQDAFGLALRNQNGAGTECVATADAIRCRKPQLHEPVHRPRRC